MSSEISWEAKAEYEGSNTTHILPVADIIEHALSADCICGPKPEYVKDEDTGDFGWMYTHFSLDGRDKDDPFGDRWNR